MEDEEILLEDDLSDIEIAAIKAHSELCVNQAFCMNGGTCYRIPALGRQYCECTNDYEGERCHMKKLPSDYAYVRTRDGGSITWNNIQPVLIVVGGTAAFLVLLFVIYLVARSCYNRHFKRKTRYETLSTTKTLPPTKTLIYKNASAQTSLSQLCLLGDVQCNGQPTTGTIARSRLPACSATPEAFDPYLQVPQPQNNLDLESGPGSTNCYPDSNRTTLTVELERENPRRESTTPLLSSARRHDSGAKSRSPNDSNNNMDALSSPQPVNHTHSKHDACIEGSQSKDVANSIFNATGIIRGIIPPSHSDELYDSDPEATAL